MTRGIALTPLEPFLTGLQLLGSGGGGNPRVLASFIRARLGSSTLTWTDLAQLPADARVVPVGYIGSTSVLTEKLPSGEEIVDAVQAVARWTSSPVDALMPIELAGLNGIAAAVPAAVLGVPLVDADLTGRALPRLDQCSLAADGLAIAPCAASEPGGQVMLLDRVDGGSIERLLRSAMSLTSGWCGMALAPQRAEDLAQHAIVGTARRVARIGSGAHALDPDADVAALAAAVEGECLGVGRVVDVRAAAAAGAFDRTSVTVVTVADGAVLRIEAENEYLMVQRDGEIVSTVPRIIALVQQPGIEILSVNDVRVGTTVAVLELPAPAWWESAPHRTAVVAPEAFGLEPLVA